MTAIGTAGETYDQFEKRRWGETAAAYDHHYLALTDQTIGLLLDRAEVFGAIDCLDLACGPGTLAARAFMRGARTIGIDFAPEMIDQARARHRGMAIEFRVGDAASLDLPDASLDAVLMNFGMMHMARPEAVAHMAGRVLRDRGRFCYTVWAPTEQSVASRIVADVMGLAEVPVQMPAGEPFYRFCDIDENRRLLGAAGFDADSIVMEDVPLLWRFSEAGELFELFAAATTRSALVLAAQSEATRRKIEDAFARAVSAWSTADGDFAIPHAAVAVTARRAGRL